MKKVEASGRTLEEALQSAAQQLGVGKDALEYELVEEGTKGFLGLGQTPTTVTAWVSEEAAAKPPKPEPVIEEPEEQIGEQPLEELEETEEVAQEEETAEEQPPFEMEAPVVEEKQPAPAVAGAEGIQPVLDLLQEVVDAMGLKAKPVLRSADNEEIVVELEGKDLAILIGKHGQTLDALQYIVGIVAHRDPDERRRLILDAEGYRERHKESLERLAHEYARAVVDEGKEAVLEPQSARDRRIVHLALADDPDVYTYSEGEGDDRHVVISPKK